MSFCGRHTIHKGVRWHRAWETEHNSMLMKQTVLKTKKYFAMEFNEFSNLDYVDTTFFRCGKTECYITYDVKIY